MKGAFSPISESLLPRDIVSHTSCVTSPTQRTLARVVSCVGEGVHGGKHVTLTLHPAPADYGIVFERLDIAEGKNRIEANWQNVQVSPLCTQIINAHGVEVRTIEHLMAALHASGIDNLRITLDGNEVPILDGSASPFFDMVQDAGITALKNPRRFIKILKTVEVKHGDAVARFEPADAPSFNVTVAYPQHHVGEQSFALDFDEDDFAAVAGARTFGFEKDLEALRAKGLTLGGSLDNAILIDKEGHIVNADGYRYSNELARHKLLDAVGDLSLAGAVIVGKFTGVRTGHALNNALLRALFADTSSYRVYEAHEAALVSASSNNQAVLLPA